MWSEEGDLFLSLVGPEGEEREGGGEGRPERAKERGGGGGIRDTWSASNSILFVSVSHSWS